MESTWIFDLDNTLHDAEKKIFPVINQRINNYISKVLNISFSEADTMRQKYWNEYGATLEGLIKNHGINPTEFLENTHTIIDFEELIFPMKNIVEVLSSISERKILYTNAPKNYTNRVIKACQIEDYFDGIFTIEDSNFKAKPSKESMRIFINKFKIKKLIDDGTISEGMLPKIHSAIHAAKHKVSTVHIIDGRVEHALILEILTDEGVGTLIKDQ